MLLAIAIISVCLTFGLHWIAFRPRWDYEFFPWGWSIALGVMSGVSFCFTPLARGKAVPRLCLVESARCSSMVDACTLRLFQPGAVPEILALTQMLSSRKG